MTYKCRKCGKESTSNHRAYCSMSLQLPEACDWQPMTSLDELGALLEKATPMPWRRDGKLVYALNEDPQTKQTSGRMHFCVEGPTTSRAELEATASLLETLRTAAPSLIAAAREGEMMRTELQRMVDHFGEFAKDHSMEATPETWAALYCARAALAKENING